MVKDHSDREETYCCHYMGYFQISGKSSFICTIPHRMVYTTAFGTLVMEPVADPDIPFGGGGGGHEMRLKAKGTVGSFGGRKYIIKL